LPGMSTPAFGVGLVHGVMATASRARLPPIADAFDAAAVIGAATDRHALLISNVPPCYQTQLEADRLFSDPACISTLAVAHHRILQAAAVVADVVPIRLGTLVAGPAGAQDLLIREAKRFADGLAVIHDALEFGVRVLAIRSPAPQATRLEAASGRDYLRARRDERAGRRPAVDLALEQLARRAVAMRLRQPSTRQAGPPPIADAA